MENIVKDDIRSVTRVLVLSCGAPYNFVPEGDTEAITGCKMSYIGTSDVFAKDYDADTETYGYFPQVCTMPPEFYGAVQEVGLPCYADIDFKLRFGQKGVKFNIVGISFIPETEAAKTDKKAGK